ncbi:MAG: glycoside hydrolase family 3 C-terminal domain-containing protein, partial [Clostridiales bacterium]|nr:glycoside hydrolase family 3 C-terminal domain-containing protein [Clostridiales bacterium]
IIETWLIGQEGSRSIADVLTGKVNPSGKLPMTVPRAAGQIPIFHYHKRGSGYDMADNTIFLSSGEGYVDCKHTPLYYFGHGLSYTDFKLSNFKMTNDKVDINSEIKFIVDIENIGDCAGSEVIQVYYRDYYSKVTRPMKQLVVFEKVYLEANEIKKVEFSIPVSSLGFTGVDDKFIVEPGDMRLMIGFSSEKVIFQKDFELVGETREIGKDRVF